MLTATVIFTGKRINLPKYDCVCVEGGRGGGNREGNVGCAVFVFTVPFSLT